MPGITVISPRVRKKVFDLLVMTIRLKNTTFSVNFFQANVQKHSRHLLGYCPKLAKMIIILKEIQIIIPGPFNGNILPSL